MSTLRVNNLTNSGGTGSTYAPGHVVQVVSTTKTDTFSMSSTTFTDVTGLSASITPKFATSKILVLATVHIGAGNLVNVYSRLLRDSTVINTGTSAGSRALGFAMLRPADAYTSTTQTTNFLDSPNTTSATTYKIQIAGNVPSACYVNRNDNDTDSFNNIRAASTITLMEVAA